MSDQKVTGNFPTLERPFIRAEIHGDDRCAAEGITVVAGAPVLGICRKLIEAGYDPATPLEAWRGDVLALRVRSIGDAAALTVDEHNGTCFAKWKPFCHTAVSPRMRVQARGVIG
jgi:hypothetical protein